MLVTSRNLRALARAVAFAVMAGSLASCVPTVYDHPYPVRAVELPRDAAAHSAPIEWWYYTGHLATDEGRRYGFEFALFKAYVPPRFRVLGVVPLALLKDHVYVAHVAVTDVDAASFSQGQRSDLWSWHGGASAQRLDAFVGDWRVEQAADGVSTRLRAGPPGYDLDLTLTPEKPAALHGEPPGIQSMGPGGTSYYVSDTRMAVTGTIGTACGLLGCHEARVDGIAWHDHQWGDFDVTGFAGWDWYSFQLDDDTEVMLYLIRAADGTPVSAAGSYVTASGRVVHLTQGDFLVEPTGATWTSPTTGAVYPLGWNVAVPRFGLDLAVTPVLDAQEMDTRATTGVVYWEGSVQVRGTRQGVGYVELTNYDRFPYEGTSAAP